MKFRIFTLLLMGFITMAASAQSLIGIWRWTTDPGAYKFLEFKSDGKVLCRDYATFTIENNYTVRVTGWIRWEGTYRKSGNALTITNKPATAKVEIVGLDVYPEVTQATYNQIKQNIAQQMNQTCKSGITTHPERYRIDAFTNELLQMQLDDDMVYYYRTPNYNVRD